MSATRATSSMWKEFVCSRSQLCIDTVLAAGQSFRWKKNSSDEWVGVMAGLVWKLRQTDKAILYRVYGSEPLSGRADNSCHNFLEINEINNHKTLELPDVSLNSVVKQEFGCSKVQLTSSSAQGKLELEYCDFLLNGNGRPTVKLECFNDSEGVTTLNCDKLQKEVLTISNCGDLQDQEIQAKNVSKLEDKEMGMIQCDEFQGKKIKNDNRQAQKRYKNGSRKSTRVIERMTSIKLNERDKIKTELSHVSSINKNLHLRKRAEQVSEPAYASQQIPRNPDPNAQDIDGTSRDDPCHKLLEDYFQTSIDLDSLYQHWSSKDPHFEKVAKNFQGVRLLRLDPTECLLSFVCSSNNHISRISTMVEKLCTHYGNLITSVDAVAYYTFPHLSDLCGDHVESHLRELGFGYRAKFIASIAKHVTQEKGEGWLESLRQCPYLKVKAELLTLLGVGAKVADCVCLMSLDKPEALPVDTHVWQFTARNYMPKLHSAKSLTEKLYTEIGDFYRDLWGAYAGWAQAVLFAADLRHNKDRSEGKEGSSNKRKACGDAGNKGHQTSKTKQTKNLKLAEPRNRKKCALTVKLIEYIRKK
ncbi:hypothetical protein BsWGS_07475 [Bradybaena similaris]